ncbi:hypothetical protein R80B4_01134 [Fibrobacteres bacterium R8-0-B4]
MSRSNKKVMGGGITVAESEADDKKSWHRAHRRKNKMVISGLSDSDDVEFVHEKAVSDPWAMSKDGKRLYWTEPELRKTVNALLNAILNDRTPKFDRYMQDMMEYFKLKTPKDLLDLSAKQVEEFIRNFMKKARMK